MNGIPGRRVDVQRPGTRHTTREGIPLRPPPESGAASAYSRKPSHAAAPCHRVVAAALLLIASALHGPESRAELLYRSAEQKGGQQYWSALKQYGSSSNTDYPRAREDGTQMPAQEVQVFLQGHISSADVYAARVMENLIRKGRQKISGNLVSLSGNGGEVEAAMELGRVLRKLGVSTVVARDAICVSSCVFAFMGGDKRTVAGRLGIHRPYFPSSREVPDRRVYYRQLQKKLQQFIDELDFPPSLYEAVMAVPSELVSILTPAELKKFYLEGMSPSAQDEANADSARELELSVQEYLQRKAAGNGVAASADQLPKGQTPASRASGDAAVQGDERREAMGEGGGAAGTPHASF